MDQIEEPQEPIGLKPRAGLDAPRYHTPRDLAGVVSSRIKWQKASHSPSGAALQKEGTDRRSWMDRSGLKVPDEALVELFETLYATSLRTEERQAIRIDVVYINKKDVFDDTVEYPWRAVPFSAEIPLSVQDLLKLARASDPNTSAIALHHDENGKILIWGLIDQRDKLCAALRHQSAIEWSYQCGIFEARIEGPGRIVVHSGQEPIAELSVSNLVVGDPSWDVFVQGSIRDKCSAGIEALASRWSEQTASVDASGRSRSLSYSQLLPIVAEEYGRSVSRLLLRIQSFHHGGAVLLTNNHTDEHLDCKYGLSYDRITHGMEIDIKSLNTCDGTSYVFRQETLASSLWFAALLSRVDGLILMDYELLVRGFGVVIKCADQPPAGSILKASGWNSYEPLDYQLLGTRHRSMMRYCYEHPESVGFVVSQDGDVRAMTRVGPHLIVWDNVCPLGWMTGRFSRPVPPGDGL